MGIPFRISCPVVYRHPVFLPFYWAWRLLFRSPKKLPKWIKEYKTLKK